LKLPRNGARVGAEEEEGDSEASDELDVVGAGPKENVGLLAAAAAGAAGLLGDPKLKDG
jgi:hypothetical protein